MDIAQLERKAQIDQNKKLIKSFNNLNGLLEALRSRDIPEDVTGRINEQVAGINTFKGSDKALKKKLQSAKNAVIKLVEKELKLVPKHHYRTLWMALGMTVFGLPIGIAISTALDNFAFLAIGLPIGMPIGMAIGSGMDKKAREEGRQLDVEFEI